MSIIAIDYGKSKCGYAIGKIFVSESGTVTTADIYKKIEKFEEVVLGLPLSMSGNYSTQTFEVIKFGLKLLKDGKKVRFIDERMTTRMAQVYNKRDDDRFSAEQILLDYLQAPDRAVNLKKSTILKSREIFCECALILEVPYSQDFHILNAIGYTEDPYIAYTMFKESIFVYRVWNDLIQNIASLERLPDCIIINDKYREMLTRLNNGKIQNNSNIEEFEIVS